MAGAFFWHTHTWEGYPGAGWEDYPGAGWEGYPGADQLADEALVVKLVLLGLAGSEEVDVDVTILFTIAELKSYLFPEYMISRAS